MADYSKLSDEELKDKLTGEYINWLEKTKERIKHETEQLNKIIQEIAEDDPDVLLSKELSKKL